MLSKYFQTIFVLAGVICFISADTCDTYRHPTYGLGTCIDQALCPNALYITGLCESKPTNVKCCFSLSSSVTCTSSTQKLTHSAALSQISAAGISISSSGGCSDRNNPTCTSLDQVNCRSISELVNYKKVSGCSMVVTGGTEVGHSSGVQSHYTGYKIDFGLNSCHDSYIKGKFTYIGIRGDGARMYKDTRGNTFALEGNHWDVLFP